MKKLIFTISILLLSYTMYGQISTREKPVSFNRVDIPALKTSEKAKP